MHYIVPGSWLICMVMGLGKGDHVDRACVHLKNRNRRKRGAKM